MQQPKLTQENYGSTAIGKIERALRSKHGVMKKEFDAIGKNANWRKRVAGKSVSDLTDDKTLKKHARMTAAARAAANIAAQKLEDLAVEQEGKKIADLESEAFTASSMALPFELLALTDAWKAGNVSYELDPGLLAVLDRSEIDATTSVETVFQRLPEKCIWVDVSGDDVCRLRSFFSNTSRKVASGAKGFFVFESWLPTGGASLPDGKDGAETALEKHLCIVLVPSDSAILGDAGLLDLPVIELTAREINNYGGLAEVVEPLKESVLSAGGEDAADWWDFVKRDLNFVIMAILAITSDRLDPKECAGSNECYRLFEKKGLSVAYQQKKLVRKLAQERGKEPDASSFRYVWRHIESKEGGNPAEQGVELKVVPRSDR